MLLTFFFCKNAFTKTATSAFTMGLPMIFSMFSILGLLMLLESDLTPQEQAVALVKAMAAKAQAKAKFEAAKANAAGGGSKKSA